MNIFENSYLNDKKEHKKIIKNIEIINKGRRMESELSILKFSLVDLEKLNNKPYESGKTLDIEFYASYTNKVVVSTYDLVLFIKHQIKQKEIELEEVVKGINKTLK